MFIGLLVGTLMAEALVSGRLGDHIIGRATARGDLPQTPEMRIWMGYPGVLLFAAGILSWGFAIENKYHIMISQLGFFLGTRPAFRSNLLVILKLNFTLLFHSGRRIPNDKHSDCRLCN